jgi:gluconokinase
MIVVVSGVTGVGKSTVGRALAEALGWEFYDADDLHLPEDREQMRRGEGLTDAQRQPWLERVRAVLVDVAGRGANAVVACSALKRQYRDMLAEGLASVRFVFLTAPPHVLRARLEQRTGHFAGVPLLASQLATVELPADGLVFDAALPVTTLVALIRERVTRSA